MFTIKCTTLTFKETILDSRFTTKEQAKEACRILNSARVNFYSVVEIEDEPTGEDLVIVTKNNKRLFVSDIRTAPGSKEWRLTNNADFAMKCGNFPGRYKEVKALYLSLGYTVEVLKIKRATF